MTSFWLGRYFALVVAIAVFLGLFAGILSLNYFSSYQIAEDAHAIQLSSRQATLSQQILTGLYQVESDLQNGRPIEGSVVNLGKSFSQFDEILDSFIYGGELIGLGQGQDRFLLSQTYSERHIEILHQLETIWQPYRRLISPVVYSIYNENTDRADLMQKTQRAIIYGRSNNLPVLELTNMFVELVEDGSHEKTERLREIQSIGLGAAVVYFIVLILVFIRRLNASDLIAQKSGEAKINFLANMSHEIRTPMNGVMGVLELISDTELDRTQRSLVSTAKTSAEGLLHVLNDILDISKIEAGKISIERTSFDLASLFEETVALFGPAASDKSLEILCSVPEQIQRPLLGDPNRIRQILSNILGNAVKFTQAGEINATLNIQLYEDRAAVQIVISDTGIGMTKETIDGLFDPFTQADESTTRKYGGTGLGLSISKQLIDLMCGKINVSSVPGKGSRFEILLNLEFSEQTFGSNQTAGGLDSARVLIVDDNRSNLKILESYIRYWGLEPCVAESAIDAIQLLENAGEHRFDLCITDYRMPEIDGLEMARQIREYQGWDDMKIILLGSGNISAARRDEFGIDAVMSKPVRRAELFRRVSLCLKQGDVSELSLPQEPRILSGRVLLVEDNKVNQLVAKSMLVKMGLKVDIAENGYKALTEMFNHEYDLVLMDCQMPMMDGYEATRQRRAHELEMELEPLPIVALTANAMKGDREKCIAAGMNDYLSKPIHPEELKQKLDAWLSRVDRLAS